MSDWYVSSAAWTAIAQFAASGTYTVGQIVRPLTAPAFAAQYAFRCTTAGAATTEPTWPAGNNATVTTGAATFTNVTGQSAYGWSAAAGNLYCIAASNTNRPNAGDRVFLSSDHAEVNATGVSDYIFGSAGFGLIQFISVNRGGSVPPAPGDALTGATITGTASWFALDSWTDTYWQGVNFINTSSHIYINYQSNRKGYFRNCSFYLNSTGANTIYFNRNADLVWDNTTLQFGATSQSISINSTAQFNWINTAPAILGSIFPTSLFPANGYPIVTMRGVDLSALTGTLVLSSLNGGINKFLFDSCRIASGVTRYSLTAPTPCTDDVELVNCFDGTNIISERYTQAGILTTNRSTTLVGGAQDDVGLFSHRMVSNANSNFLALSLDSFWMDVENTYVGSTRTATVEIVSSGSLNNSDISLVLEYQGTSGSSLATLTSTLPSALTASAALPTSSATWNNPPQNTFDPTFNQTYIILSNNNLTAAARTSNNFAPSRTINPLGTGKFYFEVTCNNVTGTGTGVGVTNQRATTTNYIGSDANGAGCQSNGYPQIAGAGGTQITGFSTGNVVCVAVDTVNQKIWFRVGAGNWDNTTDNPATNTGGYNIATLFSSSGVLYPSVGVYASTDQLTINLGGTTFAQAVPSGFSSAYTAPAVQHLQTTFTPQQAGRVRGVVRLGKPSTTVFVNPQIVVT